MKTEDYRDKKKRFEKARKFNTGHEDEVFTRLVEMMNRTGTTDLSFGPYHLKYTFSEIREEGKDVLGVIEDIPDESADLASMSFDIFDEKGKLLCETVFHRNSIETVPAVEQRHIEMIIQAILGASAQ
ncbi:MAG: hypothetical protein ACP5NK_06790 [Thermoplasmata archaeon]